EIVIHQMGKPRGSRSHSDLKRNKKGGPSRPRYRGRCGPASRGFVTLASPDHVSNPLTEAGAGPKTVLEHVDVGRHASTVCPRARSTAASLEADASGDDRGSADGNGPREGAHDEGDREEGYHVRQTFHLLTLLLAGSIKRPCGALITGDYYMRLYAE